MYRTGGLFKSRESTFGIVPLYISFFPTSYPVHVCIGQRVCIGPNTIAALKHHFKPWLKKKTGQLINASHIILYLSLCEN